MCYCAQHIPLHVSQPLDFYVLTLCFFIASLLSLCRGWKTPSAPPVIWEVKCEYISITTAVLRHAELVMRLQHFFDFISLCVVTVHCVCCSIALPQGTFEVTAHLYVRAIHKACLSPHSCYRHARK